MSAHKQEPKEKFADLRHIIMEGSPFEMGLQHGHQAADLIIRAAEFCNAHSPGFPEDQIDHVKREALRIERYIESTWPEISAEMRGISEGSGVPFPDVVMLNVRFEIDPEAFPKCTIVGIPQTGDGPVIGKTDDVSIAEQKLEVFFRAYPDNGLPCIYFAIAGTVWAVGGINSAGLAMAHAGLPPGQRRPNGLPAEIFLRLLLQRCSTVCEALEFVKSTPLLWWGHSIALADPSSDQITLVEAYPYAVDAESSTTDPIVRTNHPVLEKIRKAAVGESKLPPIYAALPENSQQRYVNAMRLASQLPKSIDGVRLFLGDHSEPGAICQHGQADMHTAVAMILVPRRRSMIVSEGYGCGLYREYVCGAKHFPLEPA